MESLKKATAVTALALAGTLGVVGIDTLVTRSASEDIQACYDHVEDATSAQACAEAVKKNYGTQGSTLSILELVGVAGVVGGGVLTGLALKDERR